MAISSSFPYYRIAVVGTTGSGKSTLAEELARKLDADFIELDALHWEPSWVETPLEVFRSRVYNATQAEAWVVAGNYHVVRDLVWSKAEAVIWLDYSFWVIFWRLWWRTWKRVFLKAELWNGNREHLRTQFRLWSDESPFHWLLQTYWRRKREYSQLFEMPEYQNLCVFHFQFPSQVKNWLESL